MGPWELGKKLVWVFTAVDALERSCLNQGSLWNPGNTATEVEARKIEKYRELLDGYIFQPVVMEVQYISGESSAISITCLSVKCFVDPTTINELTVFCSKGSQ